MFVSKQKVEGVKIINDSVNEIRVSACNWKLSFRMNELREWVAEQMIG